MIATDRRLLAPGVAEPVAWHHVLRVAWADPELEIRFLAQDGSRQRLVLELAEPGDLPDHVRERVDSSTLAEQHVWLRSGCGARLVARRDLGSDATHWTVIFDDGVDAGDAALRELADRAVARWRASLGL